MRRITHVSLLAVGLFALVAASCAEVPITGRTQLSLIGNAQLFYMSYNQYDTFLEKHTVLTSGPEAAQVRRVGSRIQGAVEEYFKQHDRSDYLDGYKWEFNVVKSKEVNAWCMPGGKVVFYTGILPICKDDAGVAVVMGHEIAHAVANHGGERMSQTLIVQGIGTALSEAMSKQPDQTREAFLTAFGVGGQLGLLKFSRVHETEADHLGLIFMTMAGYDPKAAPAFWQRMEAAGRSSTPEFLSTHPSHETRISDLDRLIESGTIDKYRPGHVKPTTEER
jgi:predicted Zn-dependent protease